MGFPMLAAVVLYGCDSNVGGVTFESGFGVSDEQAFQEGVQARQVACATNTRQLVKYKSGTDAEAAWIRGHQAALAQHCPDKM
jgi:hypothetical protein